MTEKTLEQVIDDIGGASKAKRDRQLSKLNEAEWRAYENDAAFRDGIEEFKARMRGRQEVLEKMLLEVVEEFSEPTVIAHRQAQQIEQQPPPIPGPQIVPIMAPADMPLVVKNHPGPRNPADPFNIYSGR